MLNLKGEAAVLGKEKYLKIGVLWGYRAFGATLNIYRVWFLRNRGFFYNGTNLYFVFKKKQTKQWGYLCVSDVVGIKSWSLNYIW